MFIDYAKILIKGGNGGNGKVAFHREKFVAAGGPDGGDGGRGGNVVFVVDDNISTLADFRYKRKYIARAGNDGEGGRRFGKAAEDLIVRVPRGTVVKDAETGRILADMSSADRFIAAKGGRGGWGNAHFSTPTRQCPRFAKGGMPGESREVTLELKLLADVGLIGFPNVGKSTLISVVSEAKPKIADYHFTTLTPVLGVVRLDEETSFVMADIPGLIEGAGEGVGLGHEFLRHVDRCRLLVHVIDAAGSEGRDPIEDFETINRELAVFNPELAQRPQLVVANKIDLAEEEQLARLKEYITSKGYEYHEMIAPIAEGTQELINAVAQKLSTLPPIREYEADPVPLEELLAPKQRDFTISVQGGVYMVEGEWIARILCNVNLEDYESLQYLQRALQDAGVFKVLEERGVQEGDLVSIYDVEFEYVP